MKRLLLGVTLLVVSITCLAKVSHNVFTPGSDVFIPDTVVWNTKYKQFYKSCMSTILDTDNEESTDINRAAFICLMFTKAAAEHMTFQQYVNLVVADTNPETKSKLSNITAIYTKKVISKAYKEL